MHGLCRTLLAIVPPAYAATAWQQRVYNNTAAQTPLTNFGTVNCTTKGDALSALSKALINATVAYPGDREYGASLARVWTKQQKRFPDAVVFPSTPEDVSIVLQFYSSAHALWNEGFAILGGGHADFGGGQSPSVVIDLRALGSTEIVHQPQNVSTADRKDWAVLKIGGGAVCDHVYNALDGTGWAFLGPRVGGVGIGGFLLGGGIAFQAGRYGVAVDSLLGLEVVLLDGNIIYANPYNEYSDLFWAATGGGWLASFGVVTYFYMQAYPDPGDVFVGAIAWGEDKAAEVFNKTAAWWESNTDPDAFASIVYYYKDPTDISARVPITDRQFVFQYNVFYFGGSWAKFNETYGVFFDKADSIVLHKHSVKTLDQFLASNYPYGYNRLFYGKSHTNATAAFYEQTFASYKRTVHGLLNRGEDPGNTYWLDEYVLPGWNGAGPAKDSDTAWPHSTSAHITLSCAEWSSDDSTPFLHSEDREGMMSYLRNFQEGLGEPAIYDYPNYIAPHSKAEEMWGVENFKRLVQIKDKYDPLCLLNRGLVPPSRGCVSKGLANINV